MKDKDMEATTLEKFTRIYQSGVRAKKGTFKNPLERKRYQRWKDKVNLNGGTKAQKEKQKEAVKIHKEKTEIKEKIKEQEKEQREQKEIQREIVKAEIRENKEIVSLKRQLFALEDRIRRNNRQYGLDLEKKKVKVETLEGKLKRTQTLLDAKPKQVDEDDYNFEEIFPGWDKFNFGKRAILKAGFESALNCSRGSHNQNAWKSIAKAIFPNMFLEKKALTISSNEYKEILKDLLSPGTGHIKTYDEKQAEDKEKRNERY